VADDDDDTNTSGNWINRVQSSPPSSAHTVWRNKISLYVEKIVNRTNNNSNPN
jgi:hypothetical protein